jgi:hypothetical protein
MMKRMTLLALTGLLSLPVVSLGAQTQMGMEQEDEAMNGSVAGEFSAGETDQQMPPQARIRDPFEPRSFSVTPEEESEEGEHGRIERIMGRSMEDERSRGLGTQERSRTSDTMTGEELGRDMEQSDAAGDVGAQGALPGSAEGSFRGSEDATRSQDMSRRQDGSFSESEDVERQDRSFRGSEDMNGKASGDVGAQGSFRSDTRQREGSEMPGDAAGSTGRMEGAERPLGGSQTTPGATQRSPGASGSLGGGTMGGSVGGR